MERISKTFLKVGDALTDVKVCIQIYNTLGKGDIVH